MGKLLRLLVRESRGVVALAIVAGTVGGAGGVALIALVQAELGREGGPSAVLGGAFAGLCLLILAARVVAQAAMIRLGQGAVAKLSIRLGRAILGLSQEQFEEAGPASLLAALTGDLGIIANALVGVPEICINAPVVLACFLYIGWLSPVVLACGVGFAAAAIGIYYWLSGRAMIRLRAARAEQDRLVGRLRTLIDGFRELRVHRPRREAFLDAGLAPAAAAVRDRNVAGMTVFAIAEGWGELAFFAYLGLIVFALPAAQKFDAPTLAGAALVVLYLMAPLGVLVSWLPTIGRARASVLRIQELIPSLEAKAGDEPPPRPIPFGESIALDGVAYTYRPDPDGGPAFAVGPVDLILRPGEVVFLTGGNGSGKTTLVKLVAGLYEPQGGSILVDGRPIGPSECEAYRQLVSVVFADGHVFRELLGLDPDGLDDRAREGLDRLEMAGRVQFRGGAYSTVDLSQGQRRRLALLTALLEDRPVCIFDEWAANQDPHFKKVFYLELLPELRARGKALLVITHDEGYDHAADRVVRLRDGLAFDEGPAPLDDLEIHR